MLNSYAQAYLVAINVPCAPLLSGALWLRKLFSRGRQARKLAKTIYVGSGKSNIARALLARIDAEQLPRVFGGKADGFSWPQPKSS